MHMPSRGVFSRCCLYRGAIAVAFVLFSLPGVASGRAAADPSADDVPAPPLPVLTPTPSNWEPQFPFPYDEMRNSVTPADIDAEREMCQWFNAQYGDLRLQIEKVNNSVVRSNGNFNAEGIPQQVDAVIANIDQSVEFLTPRAQVLTQSQDFAGDVYFPLYQGESFYGLWQQLSNVGNGLRVRQPNWFTGPSFQRVKHWGSKIDRSHVCR